MSDNYDSQPVHGIEYVEPSDLHIDMAAFDCLPPRVRRAVALFPAPIETPLLLAAWVDNPNEDWLLHEIENFRQAYLTNAEADRAGEMPA